MTGNTGVTGSRTKGAGVQGVSGIADKIVASVVETAGVVSGRNSFETGGKDAGVQGVSIQGVSVQGFSIQGVSGGTCLASLSQLQS